MHRQHHGGKIEQAGGSFQRMEGAQQCLHMGALGPVPFDSDQGVGCLRDQLARLGDELLAERAHGCFPLSAAT
jgi:hypothetical protein